MIYLKKLGVFEMYSDLIRSDRLPHIWCRGCGIGTVLKCLLRAISDRDSDKTVLVSGIGCTGRTGGYVFADSIHTPHGRAIPIATGIKLSNPELDVIVFSGDGDLAAIGGNHLIHAARKNIDVTCICINNGIFAMTGGQMAPTTPSGAITKTTPYGNTAAEFDMVKLVDAAGANYVARWTTYHANDITKSIKKALDKEGFRFIEVLTQCPTVFGVYNLMPEGYEAMKWFRENSVRKEKIKEMEEEKPFLGLEERIIIGEFADRDRHGLVREFRERIQMLRWMEIAKKRG